MSRRVTLYSAVLVVVVAGMLPLAVMCVKSLVVDGHLGFDYYRGIFASGRAWALLANSFKLALWTSSLATAAGIPLGILLGKTDLPGRKVLGALFAVPLLAPPYITAVAWHDILGKTGLFSRITGPEVATWTSARLFGLPGCILVLCSTFLPVTILLTVILLKTVNPRLEEAGRLVSGWSGVLKGITVPLILPGILLSSTLVFLLTMGELGVPMFLRYDVFPVESFTQFSAFLNFGAATAAAMPLALVTLAVLGMEWALWGGSIQPLLPAANTGTNSPIELGRARVPVFLAAALLCLAAVVIPYAGLLVQSERASAYAEAWDRAGASLIRSMEYAGLGAVLLTVVGFLLGYLIQGRELPLWRTVDGMTLLLFAMPGSVIGIGLVGLWNHPSTTFVYTTPLIVLLGYLAQYVAITSRFSVAALGQIPASMEEAARVAGAGWWRRLGCVVVPLAGKGLLAAWLVAYIFCLRDLSISMLVYPPGHDLFTIRTFTLMANGAPPMIAALCVILVSATLVPLAALGLLFGRGVSPRGIH